MANISAKPIYLYNTLTRSKICSDRSIHHGWASTTAGQQSIETFISATFGVL